MHDEGMIGRTTLGGEHPSKGQRIRGIGAKAVDRLGREHHESAVAQSTDSVANRVINRVATDDGINRVVTRPVGGRVPPRLGPTHRTGHDDRASTVW